MEAIEEFAIQGDSGDFLRLSFIEVYGFPNSTCPWGGYEVRATIQIKSGNYQVASTLWTSTGEIYTFFEELSKSNERLEGEARLNNYEHNLELVARYDVDGHVSVFGKFREYNSCKNELLFEFETDQTYLQATLTELKRIVAKYGGMKGIKV
ncbi:WapI family immunity protein [Hymenobacter roseosalivarius]|nr:hypothetical protein [Hymenobacter roseosalivarius]